MNKDSCIVLLDSMRNDLFDTIAQESLDSENFINPETSFSRTRLLDKSTVVNIPYQLTQDSISSTLPAMFGKASPSLTASAVTQARSKVSSRFYITVFDRMNELYRDKDTARFNGYILKAVDGSEIKSCLIKGNEDSLGGSKKGGKRAFYHLNGCFDVLNQTFCDAVIQPGSEKNEDAALLEIAGRDKQSKTIYIADRGYENLMLFHRLNKMGKHFVIRIKDEESAISLLKHYPTPASEEYDIPFDITLTCKNNRETKDHWDTYKYISSYKTCPEFSDGTTHIPLPLRVIRFWAANKDGKVSLITVCTNLPEEEFSTEDIMEIYRLRWVIEVNFRILKRTLDLEWLHSRRFELIISEIYAKMTLLNFCSRIEKVVQNSDQFKERAKARISKRNERKSLVKNDIPDKDQEAAHSVITDNSIIPADDQSDPYKPDFNFIIHTARLWLAKGMTTEGFWDWIVNRIQKVRPGRADPRKAAKPSSTEKKTGKKKAAQRKETKK